MYKKMRTVIKILIIAMSISGFAINSYSACSRIVSLAPTVTETLFYLKLGKNLVGVTRYAEWPTAAKKITEVGGYYDPNIALIVALKPDMVFLAYRQQKVISELKLLHINYTVLNFDTTGDLKNSVKKIGGICNTEKLAVRTILRIKKELNETKKICSKRRKQTALIILGSRFPVTAAGNGTFLSHMLDLMSMKNIYSGKIAWPQIPLETVVKLNPDYLFIASVKKKAIEPAMLLLKIKAVENGHIIRLVGQKYLVNSPRIAETFLKTAKKLCR